MVRDLFRTKVGVKQGDNLTPNLFKICINELPDCIKSSPDQAVVYSRPVYSLLYIYADDIAIFSTSAKGLQSKLDGLRSVFENESH